MSDRSGEGVDRDEILSILQRLKGDEWAKVDDVNDAPGYLSAVEYKGRIFPVCVTRNSIELDGGELIPNSLFEAFVQNGLEWMTKSELPDDVCSEFEAINEEVEDVIADSWNWGNP